MRSLGWGVGALLLYFGLLAPAALLLRKLTHLPDEVFRKLLHAILLGSLSVWTVVFDTWQMAALTALGFAALVYPILGWAERFAGYSALVTERRHGELKQSLLAVFAMYAGVTAVCWGALGDRMLSLCSIYAWGFGDAAAALVGKCFGRHALTGRHIEGRKSWEGTLTMLAVSFASVWIVLMVRGGLSAAVCALIAAVTGTVTATVELFTLRGMDTVTCPLAAMAVLLPLVALFGGL